LGITVKPNTEKAVIETKAETLSRENVMAKLKDLKELLDMQIISQEEFDTKKGELMKHL